MAENTPAMIPFCRTCVPAAISTRATISSAQRLPRRSQSFAAWAIKIAPATAQLANITSFQTVPWVKISTCGVRQTTASTTAASQRVRGRRSVSDARLAKKMAPLTVT